MCALEGTEELRSDVLQGRRASSLSSAQLPEKRGQKPCHWMPPQTQPQGREHQGLCCPAHPHPVPLEWRRVRGKPQGYGPRTFSSLLMELWRATLSIRPT